MALLIRKQIKLFPNVTERTILNKTISVPSPATPSGLAAPPSGLAAPPSGLAVPPSGLAVPSVIKKSLISAKDSLIEALKWLSETVNASPKAVSAYFDSMPVKYFEIFNKYGFIVAKTSEETDSRVIIGGVEYIVKPVFSTLIDAFKSKVKGLFGSLMSVFSSKPHLLGMKPEEIFDSLPDTVRTDLIVHGYTRDSPEFAALVNALSHGLHKCDEEDCIKSLTSGEDRFTLKTKLEGILKKLELNAEDDFLKFQVKVIELLNDRFSVFAKFQQKVIEELYKIGIRQIPEITPDFFQILDLQQHESDLEQMRDIYKEFDYDKI
jgi:hypothetical protein